MTLFRHLQNVMAQAMDTIRRAVGDAGENHGQPILFHIFTQVPMQKNANR
jgi:hypothetical protein